LSDRKKELEGRFPYLLLLPTNDVNARLEKISEEIKSLIKEIVDLVELEALLIAEKKREEDAR
jgi:hypothetical protein